MSYRGVRLDAARDILTPVAASASILHDFVPATMLQLSHGKACLHARIDS
jgi:hypothetical protein